MRARVSSLPFYVLNVSPHSHIKWQQLLPHFHASSLSHGPHPGDRQSAASLSGEGEGVRRFQRPPYGFPTPIPVGYSLPSPPSFPLATILFPCLAISCFPTPRALFLWPFPVSYHFSLLPSVLSSSQSNFNCSRSFWVSSSSRS